MRIDGSTSKVCQFQRVCDEQARYEFKRFVSMNARIDNDSGEIAAIAAEKDRNEQARCEFECIALMNARIVSELAVIVAMERCQF